MPVCYIIEGPTCAGKTTLAKECVKHRNGDDAWGRSLTNKLAIEYQEVAREIMLNIDCS